MEDTIKRGAKDREYKPDWITKDELEALKSEVWPVPAHLAEYYKKYPLLPMPERSPPLRLE